MWRGTKLRAVSEQIVPDLDLAVAARAGADADGRDAQAFADHLGELGRYGLEHDGESAGLLQRNGVIHEAFGRFRRLALHLVAAKLVDRLRRQADVPDTGMPICTMRRTVSAMCTPPSSFTAPAPPSCMRRPALRIASSTDTW